MCLIGLEGHLCQFLDLRFYGADILCAFRILEVSGQDIGSSNDMLSPIMDEEGCKKGKWCKKRTSYVLAMALGSVAVVRFRTQLNRF